MRLPGLLSLGTYPHTVEAVAKVHSRFWINDLEGSVYNHFAKFKAVKKRGGVRGCSSPFQLRYIHDQFTEEETFDLAVQFCPQLSSIFLDTPAEAVIARLREFPRLRRLKFNKVPFPALVEAARPLGAQVSAVEVVLGRGSLDLALLAASCPALASLELYYSDQVTAGGEVRLPGLARCVVYSTAISGAASTALLAGCPGLQHLNLSSAASLGPAQLSSLVTAGQLDNIRDLAIMAAPQLDIARCGLLRHY